ncbi:cyclin-dependent kinase 9-like [Chelonus insularis]|uniref:cyclin-dependent kinase 9-like n=1 Tax=Chelonus insularis TaxID=460826 RepID=UPI00158F052F|nr:cyclin-dependent kinase 9-like [Chelonus insularis]
MNNKYNQMEKYMNGCQFPYCDEVFSKYETLFKIGHGTYGEVFKARERKNQKNLVALKKVLIHNEGEEGFPITSLREIRILQLLNHPNIVHLVEVCRTQAIPQNNFRSSFYLIFEFCEHDLAGLLSCRKVKFNLGEVKTIMKQLFEGLHYIHFNNILHRDLKSANILITKNGVVKLADFGLSKAFRRNKASDNRTNVVTLWYRAPELLLGDSTYNTAIDIWSAGCIMAELWTRYAILQGRTEKHQLELISQLCGSITPDVWPNVQNLKLYEKMDLPMGEQRKVKERLKPYIKDSLACDLLDKLLLIDPSKRYNADAALNHNFFWTDPMPSDLSKMLAQYKQSMFEYLASTQRSNDRENAQKPTTTNLYRPTTSTADSGYQDRVY